MQTNRFETFMDAIIAIIITVLVLKLSQPAAPTWEAIWDLNRSYLTYAVCFLIIYNIWYGDHLLFQMVEEINNRVVFVYGVLILLISIIPYFASWVSIYQDSIPAETMFGLLFLAINLCYTLSTYLVIRANPYNEKLKRVNLRDFNRYVPVLIILAGFVLTYTVYARGIYLACIVATVYWFLRIFFSKLEIESSERFEALFDAIVAIIITVLVLEISMAASGSWQALFDLKIEFVAYVISFIVCFNYWNYNHNIFAIVNRIDSRVIWSVGVAMFVLSLIPYLSLFVSLNFYSFVAQACYGLDFIAIACLAIVTSRELREVDRGNIALLLALNDNYQLFLTIVIVLIGMVFGYVLYPPCVILSCLVSIVVVWLIPLLKNG